MDKSLRRRLKSDSRDERFVAIDELANLATEEGISALKRVAEGRRRAWLTTYDFEDQVYALEILAGLGQEDVNDYVRHFLSETVQYRNDGTTSNTLGIPNNGRDEHLFPNASGELARRLPYISDVHWGVGGTACPEEGYDGKPIVRNEEAHLARETILSKIT